MVVLINVKYTENKIKNMIMLTFSRDFQDPSTTVKSLDVSFTTAYSPEIYQRLISSQYTVGFNFFSMSIVSLGRFISCTSSFLYSDTLDNFLHSKKVSLDTSTFKENYYYT